uniref:glucuronosyltransferase n=1 Tax=Pristionchus pacificus TaxID=54126 RepID=A0A2A6BPR1_PRIPA|eukprot:PDM67909.1 Glycosyltransferase [Pristionchus pacificus]
MSRPTVISNEDEGEIRAICGCAGLSRYGILALSFVFLAVLQSSVIAYNATFVSMMNKATSPLYEDYLEMRRNGTEEEEIYIDWESPTFSISDRRFSFDTMQKSLSFAGTYIGGVAGTQPIGAVTMFIIGLLASLLVFITPIVVAWSFPAFVVLRFVSGLALSNLFPVAGIIVSDWASVQEKGLFIAVLSGHVELSPLITMPLSAVVAECVSWPLVFYIHGAMGLVCSALWLIYYRDRPERHPFVGNDEFRRITSGKAAKKGNGEEPPFRRIFRSVVIWAVWAAVIGNFIVAQFSITFAPMYFSYVLDYSPTLAGAITPIPLVIVLLIKLFTGLVSDRITFISEVMKFRLFNTVALLGSGLFFILVGMIHPTGGIMDAILIMIPIALLGFHAGGFPKAAVVVSQQHSPFVMSIVQMLAMVSLLVGSFIVPAFTPQNTFDQWRSVFMLYAALLVLSNTIFVIFVKAEPAKWTRTVEPVDLESALTSPPSSSESSRLLVYNPKFAHSHVNYLGRVADLLVENGFTVTSLMPNIIPQLRNGTMKSNVVLIPAPEIVIEAYKKITEGKVDYFTSNFMNPLLIYGMGSVFATVFTAQCAATLESGVVEKMKEEQFDVYIVETYDPCGMMLAHLIQPRSVILQSTTFVWQQQLDEIGIPRALSYNPSVYTSQLDVKSFWSRLMNVVSDTVIQESNGPARREVDKLFKARFGPDYPSIREQTSRVTWVFTNSEPLYDFAVPTLAKVVAVPGLGAREPNPLDENWSRVLEKRKKAVIISFGTIANLTAMQPPFKQSFGELFNAFPDIMFIFKYDSLEDEFANELRKLDNVELTKWMPQNDLLADPRVVLFITHCGMGSVQELTLRGKPGVFIPLFGDQMRNALMLEHTGNGVKISKTDVGVPEKFIAAVKEALENERYARRAEEIKAMLNGKPYSSKELLLKHVQFAGTYGTAAVMRPRSHDMNWIEYHNADVWLFVASSLFLSAILLIFLLISIIRCLFTRCCSCCSSNSSSPHYSAYPTCKRCAPLKVLTKEEVPGGVGNLYKEFTSVTPDETGMCSKKTFVCNGNGVQISLGELDIVDGEPPDNMLDMMVTMEVTCKMDGTGWVYKFGAEDIPVTQTFCIIGP